LTFVYKGKKEITMNQANTTFSIEIGETRNRCPIGETIGNRNMAQGKIPVLSCEGACIRGQIARLAANMLAKQEPFARGCHGELFSVPDSAMARWVANAEKVVPIDGCFLQCHGRIIENLISQDKLIRFDALSVYKKYTDVFDIDDVPEKEQQEAARQVADSVLADLRNGGIL
jgi:uncharacterized metal-binding protein